jgi:hypothetical protein
MIVPEQTYSAGPWWARVRVRLLWWTFWRPWRTPVMRSDACWRWRTTGGVTSPSRRPHPDIHPWRQTPASRPGRAAAGQGGDRHHPAGRPSHDVRMDGPWWWGVSWVGKDRFGAPSWTAFTPLAGGQAALDDCGSTPGEARTGQQALAQCRAVTT